MGTRMKWSDKPYYALKMTYDSGFEMYMDFETLDEALLHVKKNHEFKTPFNGEILVLRDAVIWKMKPEKVYEFIRNKKR